MTALTLSDKLRAAVRADMSTRKLSFRDVADAIGIPHATLHRFLSGSVTGSQTIDKVWSYYEALFSYGATLPMRNV